MRKSLREVLPEYEGKHVKIGFNHGNGFIFCNYVTDKTEEELRIAQELFYDKSKDYLRDLKTNYELLKDLGEAAYVSKVRKTFPKRKPDRILDEYKNRLRTARNSIAKYTELLKSNDLYLGATFVEAYESIDPMSEGAIIILLEGWIQGDYWFEEEYLGKKLPSFESLNITDRAYHALAAAVVKQAANDLPSWEAENFFMDPNRFNMFMPSYDGESILKQIKKNMEESHGKRWYADKKSRKVLEDTVAFDL